MNKLFKTFSIILLALFVIGLTACDIINNNHDDDEEQPIVETKKEVGIEIATAPEKLEYIEGNQFDPTGMVVNVLFDDESKEATTDYTYSQEALKVEDTKVVISYKEFTVEVEITVNAKQMTGIQVTFDANGAELTPSSHLSDYIVYREVYNNGTVSEDAYYVTEADLSEYELDYDKGELKTTLTVVINSVSYTEEIAVPVTIEILSIAELKTKPVSDADYLVKGIVLGSGYMGGTTDNPSYGEIFFKDETTNDIIGIRGIDFDYTNTTGIYNRGDLLVLNVKMINAATTATVSEALKVCATVTNANTIKVLSTGNSTAIDVTDAYVADSQEALAAIMGSAQTRSEYAYKMVKFVAGTKVANYSATSQALYLTFTGTSAANMKIDGLQTYLAPFNQMLNLGDKTALSLIDPELTVKTYADGGNLIPHDMYLMYAGGEGAYYHHFILFDESYITNEATPVLLGYEFTAPTKALYETNETIDLTGGLIKVNYLLPSMNREVALTAEMIKEAVDMTTDGTKEVTIAFEDQEFKFNITVSSKTITGIEMDSMPTKTAYGLTEKDAVDFTGATIKVNYNTGDPEIVAVTSDICVIGDWFEGDVACQVEYLGFTTSFNLTVSFDDSDCISVAQFQATKTAGQQYNVVGIVVGGSGVGYESHLILKDCNTMDFMQIRVNDGNLVVGPAAQSILNQDYFKPGDKVAFMQVTAYKYTNSKTNNSSNNHIYGRYMDDMAMNIRDYALIISRGNSFNYDLSTAIEVDQAGLQAAMANSDTRAANQGKLYKFNNVLVTPFISSGAIAGYHFWMDSTFTVYNDQKVDGISPYFYNVMSDQYGLDLDAMWGGEVSRDFANPIATNASIYAIYIGGNNYYHNFQILDASWVVTAE